MQYKIKTITKTTTKMKEYKDISNFEALATLRIARQRDWEVNFFGLCFIAKRGEKKMMEYNSEKSILMVAKEIA